MRIPFLSAANDLLESYAYQRKAQADIGRMAEASWSQYVDEEPDIANWQSVYKATTALNPQIATSQEIYGAEYLSQLRAMARWFVVFDSTARGALNAMKVFGWGTGARVTPNDDNPQHEEYWNRFTRQQDWNHFCSQAWLQMFRDGEIFIYDRKALTPRYVLLDPCDIRQPDNHMDKSYTHGIQTDPKDITQVVAYWHKGIPLSPQNIIHVKINCDMNEKRGRSLFEPVINDILDYRKWRRNRAKLNWVRTLIGIVKVVSGSPTRVQDAADAFKGSRTAGTDSENRDYVRQPKPAAMYVTNQPKGYEMMSPNLQAADAQHDGRMILLSIAAGLTLSEVWLTADSQNANYASQAVAESPAVQNIQFWQRFFTEQVIDPVYEQVIQSGINTGEIDAEYEQTRIEDAEEIKETLPANLTCDVQWPNLIHRDPDKEATASKTLIEAKISDPRTEAGRVGIDYNQVLENRRRDDTDQPEEIALPDSILPGNNREQMSIEIARLNKMSELVRENRRLANYVRKALD